MQKLESYPIAGCWGGPARPPPPRPPSPSIRINRPLAMRRAVLQRRAEEAALREANSEEAVRARQLEEAAQAIRPTRRDMHLLRTTAPACSSTRAALQATATLLGVPGAAPDGGGPLRGMRTVLGDLGQGVRGFSHRKVTPAQYHQFHKVVEQPEFDEERMRGACTAVAPLAMWCRAAQELFEVAQPGSIDAGGSAASAAPSTRIRHSEQLTEASCGGGEVEAEDQPAESAPADGSPVVEAQPPPAAAPT